MKARRIIWGRRVADLAALIDQKGRGPYVACVMPQTPAGWGLLLAGFLFLAFVLFKSRMSLLPRDPARAEARKRIAEAKRRARKARSDPARKARAWREAAQIALEDLRRPNLAGSYALRAVRVRPDDLAALEILVTALRGAKRYRALEKFLWRRLRGEPGPGYDKAYDALLELYEGPLRRRERAQALRAMRERVSQV